MVSGWSLSALWFWTGFALTWRQCWLQLRVLRGWFHHEARIARCAMRITGFDGEWKRFGVPWSICLSSSSFNPCWARCVISSNNSREYRTRNYNRSDNISTFAFVIMTMVKCIAASVVADSVQRICAPAKIRTMTMVVVMVVLWVICVLITILFANACIAILSH